MCQVPIPSNEQAEIGNIALLMTIHEIDRNSTSRKAIPESRSTTWPLVNNATTWVKVYPYNSTNVKE